MMSNWLESDLKRTILISENISKLGEVCGLDNLTVTGVEVSIHRESRIDILGRTELGQCVVIELQRGKGDIRHFKNIVRYARQLNADIVIWVSESFDAVWTSPEFLNRQLMLVSVSIDQRTQRCKYERVSNEQDEKDNGSPHYVFHGNKSNQKRRFVDAEGDIYRCDGDVELALYMVGATPQQFVGFGKIAGVQDRHVYEADCYLLASAIIERGLMPYKDYILSHTNQQRPFSFLAKNLRDCEIRLIKDLVARGYKIVDTDEGRPRATLLTQGGVTTMIRRGLVEETTMEWFLECVATYQPLYITYQGTYLTTSNYTNLILDYLTQPVKELRPVLFTHREGTK